MVYRHNRSILIPAASRDQANLILQNNGYGPDNFSTPLLVKSDKDVAVESEGQVTHYGSNLTLDDSNLLALTNLLAPFNPIFVNKRFTEAIEENTLSEGRSKFQVGCTIIIRAANRNAIINRMLTRYPDANTRFFTTKLSANGLEPPSHYIDIFVIDPSFFDELKTLAENFDTARIWLWPTTKWSNGMIDRAKEKLEPFAPVIRFTLTKMTKETVMAGGSVQIIP